MVKMAKMVKMIKMVKMVKNGKNGKWTFRLLISSHIFLDRIIFVEYLSMKLGTRRILRRRAPLERMMGNIF